MARPARRVDPMGDPRRHIVLVGLMGVGKSTVGRRLAKELQRPFADVDEQIELQVGVTIPGVFREQGEPAFRASRQPSSPTCWRARRPWCSPPGAASSPRRPTAPRWPAPTPSSCGCGPRPDFLAARTDPTHRPLLAGNATGTLARLLAERAPLYEQVADVAVDVEPFHAGDDKPKRALARHIAALVAGAPAEVRP